MANKDFSERFTLFCDFYLGLEAVLYSDIENIKSIEWDECRSKFDFKEALIFLVHLMLYCIKIVII